MGRKKKYQKESNKSYLLEVIATNRLYGRHIVLPSYLDGALLGLNPSSLQCAEGFKKPMIKGLRVMVIPHTNGEIPGQQEVIDHLLRYPMLYNIRHHPVIGEIQTGPFRGKCIVLFSVAEIKHYFSIDAVRIASHKQSDYANMTWRNAQTFQEGEEHYCRPDQQYLRSAFRRRYKYADFPVDQVREKQFKKKIKKISVGLTQWGNDNDVTAPVKGRQLIRLARWCHQLDQAIQCRAHYWRVKDTLLMLQGILVTGRCDKPQLFMGHCKILERLANEGM